MSINFNELSELIERSSHAGVSEIVISGDKVKVTFGSPKIPSKKPEFENSPDSEDVEQSEPLNISPDLAKKIEEIKAHERELNEMIESPDEYEEKLARLEEHELEDIPAAGEGES